MASAGGFRRRVALKLLNGNWAPESDAGRHLRDEARLLGRLQHRHIVRVDDLLQLGGRWALLMEYIPGMDAETLFARATQLHVQLPPRVVLQICAATAAALEAAYTAEGDDGQPLCVVHRDIKPSNVRLSEAGEVKVLDFGVARADFVGRESKTERVRYGSLGYMSPERLLGDAENVLGDVYALGVMLAELLTLETYGRAELAPLKQLEQVATAVAGVRARVGDELAEVVRAMLAYDAEDRPSVKHVESTLRRAASALDGPDVHDFAAANFGGLADKTAESADAAAGMLLEEGGETFALPPPRAPTASVSATIVVDDLTLLDEGRDQGHRNGRLIGGVVGFAALLTVALFAFLWQGAPMNDAAEAPALPRPAPAARAAVVEPSTAVPQAADPAVAPPEVAGVPSTPAQPLAPPTGLKREVAAEGLPAPEPTPAPAPPQTAPRLRSAKVVLTGGEGLSVTCGDVTASGVTNALLREFPAGPCVITTGTHRATVDVQTPRQVNCTLAGDSFTCG
jgi:serine/threonine-protein kinase